jgi:hypothetical protein
MLGSFCSFPQLEQRDSIDRSIPNSTLWFIQVTSYSSPYFHLPRIEPWLTVACDNSLYRAELPTTFIAAKTPICV